MTTNTATDIGTTKVGVPTQVYRVYVKAAPQQVWDAITRPEWSQQYGYGSPSEYDLRPGGAFRGLSNEAMRAGGAPEVIIDGEVLESDPPRRLVQTWRALFDPTTAAEPATRLTWELEQEGELTKLTVTHDVEGAPNTARQVSGNVPEMGGGWSWILSDLKTFLETGQTMAG